MAISIKELMEYIIENLADGTLREEDSVCISYYGEAVEATNVFNDCHELTIAE
jgi:hypothetical protein